MDVREGKLFVSLRLFRLLYSVDVERIAFFPSLQQESYVYTNVRRWTRVGEKKRNE